MTEIKDITNLINGDSSNGKVLLVSFPNRSGDFDYKLNHPELGAVGSPQKAQIKPILNEKQLLMCADGYTNNGTIRTLVNKRTDYLLGNRPKWVLDVNDVFGIEDEDEKRTAIEEELSEQEQKDLFSDINLVNKNVDFHEGLVSTNIQNLIFGRGAGGIARKRQGNFDFFGEPIAYKVLNTLQMKQPIIDNDTWEFKGLVYDYGEVDRTNAFIPSINLLPLWYNDNHLYRNTLYTGLSAVWPILAIAQSNNYINDEDLPESLKEIWAKYGFIYVGDKNPDSVTKFEQAEVGSLFFHNQEKLEAKLFELKSDLRELTDVRMANMKAMCIDFSFPMFLLFEDTANFATANQVMQAYRVGVLERDRTYLRNFLEKYWYDPMLADHLKVRDLKELGRKKVKIKATFEEITFETRIDVINAGTSLMTSGVYEPVDIAKDIGRDDIVARLKTQKPQVQQVIGNQFQTKNSMQATSAQPLKHAKAF